MVSSRCAAIPAIAARSAVVSSASPRRVFAKTVRCCATATRPRYRPGQQVLHHVISLAMVSANVRPTSGDKAPAARPLCCGPRDDQADASTRMRMCPVVRANYGSRFVRTGLPLHFPYEFLRNRSFGTAKCSSRPGTVERGGALAACPRPPRNMLRCSGARSAASSECRDNPGMRPVPNDRHPRRAPTDPGAAAGRASIGARCDRCWAVCANGGYVQDDRVCIDAESAETGEFSTPPVSIV